MTKEEYKLIAADYLSQMSFDGLLEKWGEPALVEFHRRKTNAERTRAGRIAHDINAREANKRELSKRKKQKRINASAGKQIKSLLGL